MSANNILTPATCSELTVQYKSYPLHFKKQL